MRQKIFCEKCKNKHKPLGKIWEWKGERLCYRCYQKSIKNWMPCYENHGKKLLINYSLTLSVEQAGWIEKKSKENNMKRYDYLRKIIQEDMKRKI